MKLLTLTLRLLLGLMFVVFGSNAFLHFLPMPPMPGAAGEFIGAMFGTGYLKAVASLQVLGGAFLLLGIYVPLGLIILGPIIVNIVFFHLFMAPSGLPMAVGVSVVALFLAWQYRDSFAGLLRKDALPSAAQRL